jgi:hypothetical protein
MNREEADPPALCPQARSLLRASRFAIAYAGSFPIKRFLPEAAMNSSIHDERIVNLALHRNERDR